MRPPSIAMFDKLFLGSLALGAVNAVLSVGEVEEQLAATPATAGLGSGFLIGTLIFSLAVSLLLWFFISRRASNIAKWILFAFTVLGLITLPATLTQIGGITLIITLTITALQILALFYLFKPDAKEFFARGTPRDS